MFSLLFGLDLRSRICCCVFQINNLDVFLSNSNLFSHYAAAIQCLKRKRLYEQQIEQLGNFQLRIHDQVTLYYCVN